MTQKDFSLFEQPDFDDHEQVIFASDAATGLRAIIAIHSTRRGPALGGCRMWSYVDDHAALVDALRLSRGMTYKAAIADLPLGGGKSVIIGDSRSDKTRPLMHAMGRAVNRLAGQYVIAEDVGTSDADMVEMAHECDHVVGLPEKQGGLGDPSPFTAFGVYVGIKAALQHRDGYDRLNGVTVAVQGLGHVGWHLCERLAESGARLLVSDLQPESVQRAVDTFDAQPVAPDAILSADADVLAPCALGGILNDRSIPAIKAGIVAGAANNQLAEDRHGDMLKQAGIVYVPDYVLNAGGLFVVAAERFREGTAGVQARIDGIGETVDTILTRAADNDVPTNIAADQLAMERLHPSSDGDAIAA